MQAHSHIPAVIDASREGQADAMVKDWLFLQPQQNNFRWWGYCQGEGDLDALSTALLGEEGLRICLVLPGAWVSCHSLTVSAKEKKHLSRLAPFQLEEQFAVDVDQLVLVSAAIGQQQAISWAVDKARLRGLFTELQRHNLVVHQACPEYCLLPLQGSDWTLLLTPEQCLVRQSQEAGMAVTQTWLPHLLPALLAELPSDSALQVWAENQLLLDEFRQRLPGADAASVQVRGVADIQGWAEVPTAMLNFASGDFAPRLPLKRWWRRWQQPLLAAMVLVVLSVVSVLWQLQRLSQNQQDLQAHIETVYRQAVPQGQLVDPVRQLRHLLGQQGGSDQPSQLMAMLNRVLPEVAAADHITLQSLHYLDDKQELRLNLEAGSFKQIEQLRTRLNQGRLKAELVSSNASGAGSNASAVHQARLKVVML